MGNGKILVFNPTGRKKGREKIGAPRLSAVKKEIEIRMDTDRYTIPCRSFTLTGIHIAGLSSGGLGGNRQHHAGAVHGTKDYRFDYSLEV